MLNKPGKSLYGTPYYVPFAVSGLTILPTSPLVFQLQLSGVAFDFLTIIPGTCILDLPSAPGGNTVFNTICTLRIYDQQLSQPGTQRQGYRPGKQPIHTQQFGVGTVIQWGRGVDVAIEIFTPYNLVLGALSIVETCIIPGNFPTTQGDNIISGAGRGSQGQQNPTQNSSIFPIS